MFPSCRGFYPGAGNRGKFLRRCYTALRFAYLTQEMVLQDNFRAATFTYLLEAKELDSFISIWHTASRWIIVIPTG